jgi:exopolysaccharide biosynthesis WecB/TagA/CpsF family protein
MEEREIANATATTEWPRQHLLFGVHVSATDYDEAARCIIAAARRREGAAVTHMAVHALVTAASDPSYRARVNRFQIIAPDGQPVRWALNHFAGTDLRDRVYGPELMLRLCRRAAEVGICVYLYGSTSEVVHRLRDNLEGRFPHLRVVGCEPSVFRAMTPEEDEAFVRRVNDSGAGLLFLGLGCPLQEMFAAEHRCDIRAVQVCVGAAFDFHAGNKAMAPAWMQKRGLEWLFRLSHEPGRLWRRYLVTNTTFCLMFLRRAFVGY